MVAAVDSRTRRLTDAQWALIGPFSFTEAEPDGHGIGRSRGGLTTKIHQIVDGNGLPLAIVVTGGQRNDGAMLEAVLNDIRVPGQAAASPARHRMLSWHTRPTAVESTVRCCAHAASAA